MRQVIVVDESRKTYYDANFKIHRDNGPAILWKNGRRSYYKHGYLHREDGPAIENSNGKSRYYLENKRLMKSEFDRRIRRKLKRQSI
jgi:hypothetical protein